MESNFNNKPFIAKEFVEKKKIPLCIDFDGVISDFSSGWIDPDVIVDPPVPGVAEALEELSDAGFIILIFSCRSRYPEGREAMRRYMREHDLYFDKICEHKPTAAFYIDDHGWEFRNWHSTLNYMLGFKQLRATRDKAKFEETQRIKRARYEARVGVNENNYNSNSKGVDYDEDEDQDYTWTDNL